MQEASPEPVAESPACRNCGEKLLGDFCWRCGQEAADFHRPLRSLAADFLDNVLSLDTKLLRTLGPLLFRPGRLTREYLAGRRASYVRPLKLYLLAALLSFGVLAIWPESAVKVVVKDTQAEEKADDVVSPPPFGMEGLDFEKALADPQRFAQSFTANLPRAFFLFLPVFALLLKLLYLKRGILYLDHLVFALYFHAFAFLVMAAAIPINETGIPRGAAAAIGITAWIWIFVYLFLALRTVYRDSRLTAVLRFAALILLYGTVFGFALFGLTIFTVYRLGS